MTEVYLLEHDGFISLRIHGHTRDIADGTPNIVCAAVSILGQTAVQVMREAKESGMLEVHGDAMMPGNLEIYIKAKPGYESLIRAMMIPVKIGFDLLSSTYPKAVSVGWGNKGEEYDILGLKGIDGTRERP